MIAGAADMAVREAHIAEVAARADFSFALDVALVNTVLENGNMIKRVVI